MILLMDFHSLLPVDILSISGNTTISSTKTGPAPTWTYESPRISCLGHGTEIFVARHSHLTPNISQQQPRLAYMSPEDLNLSEEDHIPNTIRIAPSCQTQTLSPNTPRLLHIVCSRVGMSEGFYHTSSFCKHWGWTITSARLNSTHGCYASLSASIPSSFLDHIFCSLLTEVDSNEPITLHSEIRKCALCAGVV